MNRHQRRKRALVRKANKLRLLASRAATVREQEVAAKALSDPTSRKVERSPKGMGNRGIYSGLGLYPTKGYGTGAFKPDPVSMTDGQERVWRARIAARVDKA